MIIPKIFYAFPGYILKAMHLLFRRNNFHIYFGLKIKVRNLLLSTKKKPRVKLLVPPPNTHTQKNRRTRNRTRIRRNRESKGNERMVAGERFWKDGSLAKTDKIRIFFIYFLYTADNCAKYILRVSPEISPKPRVRFIVAQQLYNVFALTLSKDLQHSFQKTATNLEISKNFPAPPLP